MKKIRKFLGRKRQRIRYLFRYFICSLPKISQGVTYKKRNTPIIISLTSYKKRYSTLALCIKSLLSQSVKPDFIHLYISEKDAEIPSDILRLTSKGLIIKIVPEDLGPHGKYYHVMQSHGKNIVITVDDDILYDKNLIRDLVLSYNKYPNAISARRVHLMCKSKNAILPYNQWSWECTTCQSPSLALFATGVGGVLYPPEILPPQAFDKEEFKKLILKQDDIWLKYIELKENIPVVYVPHAHPHLMAIKEAQTSGLCNTNVSQSQNDFYIKTLSEHFSLNLADYALDKGLK